MRKFIEAVLVFFILGAMAMLGMRTVEYLWKPPAKEIRNYVCIEKQGEYSCKEWERI